MPESRKFASYIEKRVILKLQFVWTNFTRNVFSFTNYEEAEMVMIII